jgi:hypothetical protein
VSIGQTFGPITLENIRRRWRDHIRLSVAADRAGLEAAWDAMADPAAARDIGAALSEHQGRVCHFFALLRAEIGDTAQDGDELTAQAWEAAARISKQLRGVAPEWGPGGDRERWT